MDGVKHFSDFFKNNGKKELPKFDKDEILNDFFINESDEEIQNELTTELSKDIDDEVVSNDTETYSTTNESNSQTEESFSKDEVEMMIQKEVERIKRETLAEFKANESKEVELPIEEEISEEEFENNEEVSESNSEFYKVYADKAETFSCDIELEGANLKDTEVRLVLESDNWNLMFPGEIDRNGKVTIPIRKLNIFEEGTRGKIKMEVIAEGTVFTPWEDDFEVKMSKKVMIKFNESKTNSNKPKTIIKPGVKVNFKK
jgi:hypothetical protein